MNRKRSRNSLVPHFKRCKAVLAFSKK